MNDSPILTCRLAAAFLAPAGLLVFAFLLVPAIGSILQCFTNFTLLRQEPQHGRFTGLENYLLSLVLYNTGRGAAFSMLLFDAVLRTIPASYYEAASVSGATGWMQFRDITWPLIRPQLVTDLLLITLWTFNDFAPYLLTG